MEVADATTTLQTLRQVVAQFVAERNWEQFHSPKNLSMGAAVEAAELMEHFLWIDNNASRSVTQDSSKLSAVAEEIADVACYLLALCNALQLDLSKAVVDKIAKNAIKYPAEKYRGRYALDHE